MARKVKDPKQRHAMLRLRLEGNKEKFEIALEAFEDAYMDTPSGSYFVRNYGKTGSIATPESWARCYNPNYTSHNLFCER